jgi:hypothetical protein
MKELTSGGVRWDFTESAGSALSPLAALCFCFRREAGAAIFR